MPFFKTTTVPPVNRPFQWKNPNSSRLFAYFMDLAEDVSTTSPRKTPARYARNTGTNKLTVTVTFETTSVTPVTKVLTKLCCPLRATLTKPPIFRNFLLCKKSWRTRTWDARISLWNWESLSKCYWNWFSFSKKILYITIAQKYLT